MYADVIDAFARASRDVFGDNLVGVYLHGSAAMGCFNPASSDIDLITIVDEKPTDAEKYRFMEEVFRLNARAPKKGIEMSVVKANVCKPFVYPTPFELHFSPMHIQWWQDDPNGYIEKMNGTDIDLAAHFTIIRARGIALVGKPISDVFGEVPKADYFDSIFEDSADAENDIIDNPVYVTLNLCRVEAFAREGLVLSKKEGGEWGLRKLNQKYAPIIEAALREYVANVPMKIEGDVLKAFARDMVNMIKERS